MSRTVTLELADEDYALIEREARATGRTPAEVMTSTLQRHAARLAVTTPPSASAEEPAQISGPISAAEVEAALRAAAEQIASQTGQSPDEIIAEFRSRIRASPRSDLSRDEQQAARQRLEAFFGSVDSGDPNSADNERIDADLAREYGRGLDWNE
jgi:hypothetical protein